MESNIVTAYTELGYIDQDQVRILGDLRKTYKKSFNTEKAEDLIDQVFLYSSKIKEKSGKYIFSKKGAELIANLLLSFATGTITNYKDLAVFFGKIIAIKYGVKYISLLYKKIKFLLFDSKKYIEENYLDENKQSKEKLEKINKIIASIYEGINIANTDNSEDNKTKHEETDQELSDYYTRGAFLEAGNTQDMIRRSKKITSKADMDYLLNLSQRQLESLSFIMETFGSIGGKPPRFNTYDIIDIPIGAYGKGNTKNKNAFTTTVGRWVFNKCFIEQDLFDVFHYINKPIDKKVMGWINDEISYAVLEDRVPLQALKNYLMRCQKYQPYSNVLCAGFTSKMLLMSKTIKKKKDELLKKYAAELADEDQRVYAADKIEKELLAYSKEILKKDPSMDLYDSGAKGSFGNNFKNLFVMRGVIKDPDPAKGYDFVSSNLIDGISKDDYSNMAKSLSAGPYARAIKTAKGGYWEKLLLRAFQHLTLAPKGTDCGTHRTITITITPKNIGLVMYNYIVDNGQLVELTTKTRDKYMGKTVQMRFSSLCEYHNNGQICNVCAGNMFYRTGFVNVGTAIPQVASKLKLISLKAFHDSTVKLHDIDVMKAFGLKDE